MTVFLATVPSFDVTTVLVPMLDEVRGIVMSALVPALVVAGLMLGAWIAVSWALGLLGGGGGDHYDLTLSDGQVLTVDEDGWVLAVDGVDAEALGWDDHQVSEWSGIGDGELS